MSAIPLASAESPPLRIPDTGLDGTQRAVHALNRLAYGPRPGDVEQVRAMGVERWIEQQLEPEVIPDAAIERLLAPYTTLSLDPIEMLVEYPPPPLIRGIAQRLERFVGRDALAHYFPELDDRGSGPGPGLVLAESAQARLVRAVAGERQLEEILVDFWFNHFNVYSGKGADRWLVAGYERDAIRPHAMGRFRDLLGAVARHPAMLFYLDNWLSSAPDSRVRPGDLERLAILASRDLGLPPGGVPTLILRERGMETSELEQKARKQESRQLQARRLFRDDESIPGRAGLNENYARELLELHTLGVDGGYTQKDIVEVARCFTGWTLLPLRAGQGFAFVDGLHDRGKKVVLGKKIQAKGMGEGEAVLDLLARHPSTARFVSEKLARRFVQDDPPTELVEAMAATFLASDGDIRAVLRTLVSSPAFWSPAAVNAKVKTPLEFVVSAVRATGGELALLRGTSGSSVAPGMDDDSFTASEQPPGLILVLRTLGQPLYGAEPPTGYHDSAEAWVSAGALLARMKIAMALATNRVPGVQTPADAATGLMLASPEFQRR